MKTAWALAASILVTSASTFAQDKSACVSAYEQGQVDRRAGHFDAARRDFATCTDDSCPSVVRDRCVQFARELEAAQPALVIVVRDTGGRDVAGARIAVDGGALAAIPAAALRVDPGEHVLVVETELGRSEQHVVVREGEKERRVDVVVGAKHVEILAPVTFTPSVGKPVAAWVMTATAIVSLVGAGALSATGWGIYASLSSSCQHACTEDQVAPLRVVWPVAFAALGVGVVAAAIATVLFAVHPRSHEHVAVWLGPSGVGGTF